MVSRALSGSGFAPIFIAIQTAAHEEQRGAPYGEVILPIPPYQTTPKALCCSQRQTGNMPKPRGGTVNTLWYLWPSQASRTGILADTGQEYPRLTGGHDHADRHII